MDYYASVSRQIRDIFEQFTSLVEPLSLVAAGRARLVVQVVFDLDSLQGGGQLLPTVRVTRL